MLIRSALGCTCGRKCNCTNCVVCRRDNRSPQNDDRAVLAQVESAIAERVVVLATLTIQEAVKDLPGRFERMLDVGEEESLPDFPEPYDQESLADFRKRVEKHIGVCQEALITQRLDVRVQEQRESDEHLNRLQEADFKRKVRMELTARLKGLVNALQGKVKTLWAVFEVRARKSMDESCPVETVAGTLTIVYQDDKWKLQEPKLKEFPEPDTKSGRWR